jgi:hypothetical protein
LKVLPVGCEAFDAAQRARKAVTADGLTVRDRSGQVRAHPLLAEERRQRESFVRAIVALGLDRPMFLRKRRRAKAAPDEWVPEDPRIDPAYSRPHEWWARVAWVAAGTSTPTTASDKHGRQGLAVALTRVLEDYPRDRL